MSRAPSRPGTVIAAAVLLFTFGGFSILRGCCGIANEGLQDAVQGMVPQPPPIQGKKPFNMQKRMQEEMPSRIYVQSVLHIVDFGLGIFKIFLGIGLLKLSERARILTVVIAGITIVEAVGEQVYQVLVVMPAMQIIVNEQLQNAPMPPGFGNFLQAMQGLGWVGSVVTIAISIGIWLTVVFLLSGSTVRTAFAEAGKPPPDDDDADRRRSRYEGYEDDDDRRDDTGITDRPPPPQAPPETGITDRPS